MGNFIAYCGINCAECGAYLALQNNDQELREKTAAEWTAMHQFNFTPEMINCSSCKGNGVQVGYCSQCEIRACALDKAVENCGACGEYKSCNAINNFLDHIPAESKNKFLENLGRM